MFWQLASAFLILILTIMQFAKVPQKVLIVTCFLALCSNLYAVYLKEKPTNIGDFKSPLFEYNGEGIILFGNSTIKLKNGGGLVVVDHKTLEPLIKIERILYRKWLFFKRDQLVVSGNFWDADSNQIITLKNNEWKADPKVMWNSEIRNDLIKIYGSDPDREPILLCQIVNENTIKVECKSKTRDLYFSATKNGITVNGFGFTDKMLFDGKEQRVVKFVIGGPSSQIVFEAEGSGFYVSGYNPPAKTERENLFTAIITAPVIELTDWKNEKKLRPDVPFWEALRSSHKIGTLPNSNISIWNTVLSHDRENEFYPLLIKSKWYVGGTYNEAQASHPDIMVYALECEVERGTQNGTETRRIKMADIKDGDIVLKRNLHPIEFAGFKQ